MRWPPSAVFWQQASNHEETNGGEQMSGRSITTRFRTALIALALVSAAACGSSGGDDTSEPAGTQAESTPQTPAAAGTESDPVSETPDTAGTVDTATPEAGQIETLPPPATDGVTTTPPTAPGSIDIDCLNGFEEIRTIHQTVSTTGDALQREAADLLRLALAEADEWAELLPSLNSRDVELEANRLAGLWAPAQDQPFVLMAQADERSAAGLTVGYEALGASLAGHYELHAEYRDKLSEVSHDNARLLMEQGSDALADLWTRQAESETVLSGLLQTASTSLRTACL